MSWLDMFKKVKDVEEYVDEDIGEAEDIQYDVVDGKKQDSNDEEGEEGEGEGTGDYADEYKEDINDYGQQPTWSDTQRVGFIGSRIEGKGSLQDIEKEIEKRTKGQNPDIRFRERIQAISRNYIDNEIINYKIKGRKVKFDADTISDILKSVDYIQTVQYKNPTAYILGFFASNGGVEIDEESIQNIFKLVTDKKDKKGKVTKDAIIKDGNVKPADIIRYANLWINIRKLMD